jgi:signal peptidase
MQPQLDPGDGFIGVPPPLAGNISECDVVTFDALALSDGGLTTHRIVNRTEQGYITQGDNNDATDQATVEPPVTRSQIKLVALQRPHQTENPECNLKPVEISNIGSGVQAIKGGLNAVVGALPVKGITGTNPGVLVAVVGLVLVVGSEGYNIVTSDNQRSMSRSAGGRERIDSRIVLIGLLIIISLPLASVMMLPSEEIPRGVEASLDPVPNNPADVRPGKVIETEMGFQNDQLLPMVVGLKSKSEGLEVTDRILFVGAGDGVTTDIRLQAPDEPTRQKVPMYLSTQFYIPTLPPAAIGWLHSIHPLVALVGVFSVIWIPTTVLYWFVVGFGHIRLRDVS